MARHEDNDLRTHIRSAAMNRLTQHRSLKTWNATVLVMGRARLQLEM